MQKYKKESTIFAVSHIWFEVCFSTLTIYLSINNKEQYFLTIKFN